jgi:hypothetical protein
LLKVEWAQEVVERPALEEEGLLEQQRKADGEQEREGLLESAVSGELDWK